MYYILKDNYIFASESIRPVEGAYPGMTIIYLDEDYQLEYVLPQEKITEGLANLESKDGDTSRARAAYESLVGVKIQDMTLAQLRTLLAVVAYKEGFLDATGAVKTLRR